MWRSSKMPSPALNLWGWPSKMRFCTWLPTWLAMSNAAKRLSPCVCYRYDKLCWEERWFLAPIFACGTAESNCHHSVGAIWDSCDIQNPLNVGEGSLLGSNLVARQNLGLLSRIWNIWMKVLRIIPIYRLKPKVVRWIVSSFPILFNISLMLKVYYMFILIKYAGRVDPKR